MSKKFYINRIKINQDQVVGILNQMIPIAMYNWGGIGEKTIEFDNGQGLYYVKAFGLNLYVGKEIDEAIEEYNQADVDLIGKPIIPNDNWLTDQK